ncbi:DUF732 domain-containing protein [Rhodococcus wratislaviensis]|uniref:DUF732 domain-containing protein n=1 Tax=Rhodococcus wratislaviensis NBRC 100605 TaxID=1219028 RepID=X0PRJ3_RHOWR|nr:DUF732 domain-containing protein [Rhodococcus wratislaviensis]GAF45483.1 hypothetical protein RW1_022_00600 [Rhodococcus wratislaviensis NBRC 100605]
MFPKSVKSAARVAAVTAVLGVAAVGGVGVANATSHLAPEEVYLTALDEEGIAYNSAYYAVATAYAVCGDFEGGYGFYEIGLDFLSESAYYSPYQVGYLIADAVTVYCPQYTYALPA